jgi:hypothetical protein
MLLLMQGREGGHRADCRRIRAMHEFAGRRLSGQRGGDGRSSNYWCCSAATATTVLFKVICSVKPAHPREHPPSLFSRPDRGSICCLMTFGDADLRGLDWNAGEYILWRTCLALLYNCEIVYVSGDYNQLMCRQTIA